MQRSRSDVSVEGQKHEYLTEDESIADLSDQEAGFRWVNIIFLPFQTWWQWIMLYIVLIRVLFGPLHTISQDGLQCNPELFLDIHPHLKVPFFTYHYLSIPLYIVDTFFYIIHRQVSDEAMKREHASKPGLLILLDVLSLIPLYDIFADHRCSPVKLWPHILFYNELLIIYRIWDSFSLRRSHNYLQILVGYTALITIVFNALTCFFIMWTRHGLCNICATTRFMDWRSLIYRALEEDEFSASAHYLYGLGYIVFMTMHKMMNQFLPYTYVEYIIANGLMLFGYLAMLIVIDPKFFGEAILQYKNICHYHPRVNRIIEDTQRRNQTPSAAQKVESYYSILWIKSDGISTMPPKLYELPSYLIKEIRLDIASPLFYHSPTFRKTSPVYKRWIAQHIELSHKQPGERFYSGPHCYNNLYYVKSGIVQLLSVDDSTSPVLSVTGGTVFGDISFYIPPKNRRITARCLTYCEVLMIPRVKILMSLHKFPEDRCEILKLIKYRLKHAHDLYALKQLERGKDRTEDEGLLWLKTRWWEIFEAVRHHKSSGKSRKKCELSPEEKKYHCSKYIGQLVLCTDIKLQRKSIFLKVDFPWVLAQFSAFNKVWDQLMKVIVFMALLLYPPNILILYIGERGSIQYLFLFIDVFYTIDTFISLATSMDLGDKTERSFISVLLQSCKRTSFILDVLSTLPCEIILYYFTKNPICKFNRLIKTYLLFYNKRKSDWNKKWNLSAYTCYEIVLAAFVFFYVPAYIMVIYLRWVDNKVTEHFIYGHTCVTKAERNSTSCQEFIVNFFKITSLFIHWMSFTIVCPRVAKTKADIVLSISVMIFYKMLHLYLRSKFMAVSYRAQREKVNFQYFVSNIKKHYLRLQIHPDLIARLDRYLDCHWKHYNGMDIMHPYLLKNEPFGIYHRFHGALAEKILGESNEFKGAEVRLIRQLASIARYMIMPRNSALTVFGFPMESAQWVVQGIARVEFLDEKAMPVTKDVPQGKLLATMAVFLGKGALISITAITDIEVLYIKIPELMHAIRRFPQEHEYFTTSLSEIEPLFDDVAIIQAVKFKDKKMRERVFQGKPSVSAFSLKEKLSKISYHSFRSNFRIPKYFKNFRSDPEALITRHWFILRAIVVVVSFTSKVFRDMSAGYYTTIFGIIDDYLGIIVILDIILKLFLPFYKENGLFITHIGKCACHYLSRNFIVDVLGFVVGTSLFPKVVSLGDRRISYLVQKAGQLIHIYLVTGLFNYYADSASTRGIWLLLIKWQVVLYMVLAYGTFFLTQFCFGTKIVNGESVKVFEKQQCWMPPHLKVAEKVANRHNGRLYHEEIMLIIFEALRFTLNAAVLRITKEFNYHANEFGTVVHHNITAVFFWFHFNICQTLLILYYRGYSVYDQNVGMLKSFLKDERVPKDIIKRSENYFSYRWKRTAGIKINELNERIGVVFRQELNYYFYKKTFKAVDTLLKGGVSLERLLASSCLELYCLPGEDVMREMDLTSHVYIVHRGKISITKNKKRLATLTKGSIFGQLEGKIIRPSRVSASATDHADLLMIDFQSFREAINRHNTWDAIKSNPQSKHDYMAMKKAIPENPYNSIQYILRGSKTIKIPRIMLEPVNAEDSKWYERWLLLVWVIGPITSSALVLLLLTLPVPSPTIDGFIILFDVIHVIHVITDCFCMELQVVDKRCLYVYKALEKIKRPWLYIDIVTLSVPILSFTAFDNRVCDIARVLRIYSIFFYHYCFCTHFQAKFKSLSLKLICVLLLLHAVTCGWILIFCRHPEGGNDPSLNVVLPSLILANNKEKQTINPEEWQYRFQRRSGCPLTTPKHYKRNKTAKISVVAFLTPVHWQLDYRLALTNVIQVLTRNNINLMLSLNLMELSYEVFVAILLYVLDLWFTSMVISMLYTSLRNMYHFDFDVLTLLNFLRRNDLSKVLLENIRTYCNRLWQRQKGQWLPHIVEEAPLCLREDILSALYMHHLLSVPTFEHLPDYFLKQLAVRFKRIVVFPGKTIIKQGEISTTIYFIHEGEIERWYTDKKGDDRLSGVLGTNSHFGLIPGLFPNTPFSFTYCTRTVVDLITLDYENWNDLLDGYPELKIEIYNAAVKLKNMTYVSTVLSKCSIKGDVDG